MVSVVYNNGAFQDSPYRLVGKSKTIGGRIIERYLLDVSVEAASAKATQVVLLLLEQNQHLCPTFATDSQELLKRKLGSNVYLIVNGRAVSLSKEREADAASYKDRYFSGALLKEPVRCSHNHLFERKRAQIWASSMNNLCPVGDHPIGNLEIDDELQDDIRQYRQKMGDDQDKYKRLTQVNEGLIKKVKEKKEIIKNFQQLLILKDAELEQNQNAQQQQKNFIRGIRNTDPWMMGSSGGKLLIKAGGKKVVITLAKFLATTGSKESGKIVGKSIAKTIPFLSLFLGIGLAIYRSTQGQYGRAFAELVSGGAACVPVYGTAISISLDIGIGGYDVYEADTARKTEFIPTVKMDLKLAYQVLEIDLEQNADPTKEEVNRAWKKMARRWHPDKASEATYEQEQLGQFSELVNIAKETIYKQRGWDGKSSFKAASGGAEIALLEMEETKSEDFPESSDSTIEFS